jgi:hypothetical protein
LRNPHVSCDVPSRVPRVPLPIGSGAHGHGSPVTKCAPCALDLGARFSHHLTWSFLTVQACCHNVPLILGHAFPRSTFQDHVPRESHSCLSVDLQVYSDPSRRLGPERQITGTRESSTAGHGTCPGVPHDQLKPSWKTRNPVPSWRRDPGWPGGQWGPFACALVSYANLRGPASLMVTWPWFTPTSVQRSNIHATASRTPARMPR